MNFNFDDRPARQDSRTLRLTLRGVLTTILLALAAVAALELVAFAQDYLRALRG